MLEKSNPDIDFKILILSELDLKDCFGGYSCINNGEDSCPLKDDRDVLGIPSPKEDMDGNMVHEVYYDDHDINRIVEYCELDVITLAQVFLKLRNEDLLGEDEIKKVL